MGACFWGGGGGGGEEVWVWRGGEGEKSPLPVAINLMAIHEGVFFEATG